MPPLIYLSNISLKILLSFKISFPLPLTILINQYKEQNIDQYKYLRYNVSINEYASVFM